MWRGGLWRWALCFLCLLVVGWLARAYISAALRWTEKRYFAYIADNGPLLCVQRGKWSKVQSGLWVRSIVYKRKHHWSKIRLHLTRVEPQNMQVKLWWGQPRKIQWIMQNTKAVAAINGGPFLPQNKPWGLFKQAGQLLQKHLFQRAFDGVFYVKANRVGIASAKGWSHRGHWAAFQSSPVLVKRGKRSQLTRKKWRIDRRSALCLDHKDRLLLMTTDGFFNGLSYYELSLLMAASHERGGFQCKWGLNLDGGASSQWAVRQSSQTTIISGLEKTPLYLLVLPRQNQSKRKAKRRTKTKNKSRATPQANTR